MGVVGLGVGYHHAKAFAATPECEVVAVCDQNAERAHEVVRELGGGCAAATFEQILDDRRIAIVSIASFDQDHAAQTLAALDAGKHVFVEKPLCMTDRELQLIHGAWSARHGRLKLGANLVLRAATLYQWLKRVVQTGDLGRVYAFDGDYLYGRVEKVTSGWRKDVPQYSVMLGGGVHLVHLMLWLTGERPTTVWAMGNKIATSGTAFRYDDYVAATVRAPSGLVGRITANFGCVHRHQHVIRVFGTAATVIYDDAGPRLHRARTEAATPVDLEPQPPSKGALIPEFAAAVAQDLDFSAQTREILDTMSVCLACDAARRRGAAQEVVYL